MYIYYICIYSPGDVDEKVYMEEPLGFTVQGELFYKVCHLHRSIYDLNQSPRFGCFCIVIQHFGMIRSKVDHSLF